MNYETNWNVIKEIGEGGQGKVSLVENNKNYNKIKKEIIKSIRIFSKRKLSSQMRQLHF